MRTGPPTGARPVPARLVPTPPGAAAWPCWWLHVAAVRERSGEGEEGAEGGGEAELAALLLLLCAARHGALRLAPSRHKPCKTTTSKNPAAHPTLNPHNHGWIRGRQGWEKLLTGGVRGAGTPPHSCTAQRTGLGAPPASPVPFPLPAPWACAPGNTGEQKSSGRKQRKRERSAQVGSRRARGRPRPGSGGGGALPANRTRPTAAPPRGETEARRGRLRTPALPSAVAGMTPTPPAPPCSCRNPRAPAPGAPPASPLPPAHGTGIGSGLAPAPRPAECHRDLGPAPCQVSPPLASDASGQRWRTMEAGGEGRVWGGRGWLFFLPPPFIFLLRTKVALRAGREGTGRRWGSRSGALGGRFLRTQMAVSTQSSA